MSQPVRANTRAKPYAFISYREGDALAHARSLHEQILSTFGASSAFLDFRTIPRGHDWRQGLETACSKSTVVVAVIGKNWLASLAERARHPDVEDWVRKELICAQKMNLKIFAVAVAGASIPKDRELPPELKCLSACQGMEITERYWDQGVAQFLGELEKLGFRRCLKVSTKLFIVLFLGFCAAIAAALYFGVAFLAALPLAALASFVCVLIWTNVSMLVAPERGRELPVTMQRAHTISLSVAAFVLCATFIALWTCLFFGYPVDMRYVLNPRFAGIIRRQDSPQFSALAVPTPIAQAFPSPSNSGQGIPAETLTSMSKFQRWIEDGATGSGPVKVYVYRFKPAKPDYYKAFCGEVIFPDLTNTAALAEGAAFLVQNESNPADWRQVALWINDKNISPAEMPRPPLQNELRNIEMNSGDTLLLILKFQSAPMRMQEFIATPLGKYQARIATKECSSSLASMARGSVVSEFFSRRLSCSGFWQPPLF